MINFKLIVYAIALFLFFVITVPAAAADESKTHAAIIITGEDFHHEGLAFEQAFLKKDFDTHLVQVRPKEKNTGFAFKNWSKTPIAKQIENKHYKKLFFTVNAHGNESYGASLEWDSLLKLIKFVAPYADELYVHLDTCYSGGVVEKWMKSFPDNVKIFSTSSCPEKKTVYDTILIDHTVFQQIITGYYVITGGQDENALSEDERDKKDDEKTKKVKNLNLQSTFNDIVDLLILFGKKCGKENCSGIHQHLGGNEKLKDWKFLPKHFAQKKCFENGKVMILSFPFGPFLGDASTTEKSWDKEKLVQVNGKPHIVAYVNTIDPINAWKIRTADVYVDGEEKIMVPKNLKDADIPPYSQILNINNAFNTETYRPTNFDTMKEGVRQLEGVSSLKVAYYENKYPIWVIAKGDPEADPYAWYYVVIIGALSAVCIGFIIKCAQSTCKRNGKETSPPQQQRRNQRAQELQPKFSKETEI